MVENQEKNKDKENLELIVKSVKTYPDFPKPGILFYDIFSLLSDSKLFKILLDLSEKCIKKFLKENNLSIDLVAGLESRGFLLATLADRLGSGFIPIRKKTEKGSKLPGETINIKYGTEYSKDAFELQLNYIKKGAKVFLVDDLLATGGSAQAAETLVTNAGGTVVGLFCPFEICFLKGRNNLKTIKPEAVLSIIELKDWKK